MKKESWEKMSFKPIYFQSYSFLGKLLLIALVIHLYFSLGIDILSGSRTQRVFVEEDVAKSALDILAGFLF